MRAVTKDAPQDYQRIITRVIHPAARQKLSQPMARTLPRGSARPAPVLKSHRERRCHLSAGGLVTAAKPLRHHREDPPARRTAESLEWHRLYQCREEAPNEAVAPDLCAATWAAWLNPLE